MPLAPLTRLGPYEILASIGAGGMGEVYRALGTRLGREVAVKVLPASVANDSERLQRFELEARATSKLNHANILAIHDVGSQDGIFYLVAELLEGATLQTHSTVPSGPALDGSESLKNWWALKDLNLRPTDYESAALTAELRAR